MHSVKKNHFKSSGIFGEILCNSFIKFLSHRTLKLRPIHHEIECVVDMNLFKLLDKI